jgi:Ni,Fe-hydrogenase III large subunit
MNDCFLSARSVRHRLAGTGVVSLETARQLGLVGMAARSSGVALDARTHGHYERRPIRTCIELSGDCWARARLRIAEIDASLDWLDAVIAEPRSWQPIRAKLPELAGSQVAIAVVEGWRGEVVHCLENDARGALLHYKVQDPSLRNWLGLALAVRGNEISDFPICNKSFDLSYCGNDL